MRGQSAGASTEQCITATRALPAASSPAEILTALSATLCSSPEDQAALLQALTSAPAADRSDGTPDDAETSHLAAEAPSESLDVDQLEAAGAWSATELLRERDFTALDPDESAEVERMVDAALVPLRRRRTRLWTSSRRRAGRLDQRRIARAALRGGGDPDRLSRLARRWRPRPTVLLLDTSGSMAAYSRLWLAYAHALLHERRTVEVFGFGTRLTRLTRALEDQDRAAALRLAHRLGRDWGAGTQIGASLFELNRSGHLNGGEVLAVFSDGWDRGSPDLLATEMDVAARRAHRILWLSPLKATRGFEPLTRGLQSALPHVDEFLSAHSLSAMANLDRRLAAAEREH